MKIFILPLTLTLLITAFLSQQAFSLTASFTYSQRGKCAPNIVEFVNKSSTGAGITYTWDFGLGAVVTTTDPSKKVQFYTQPGQYTVILKVTDGVTTQETSQVITILQGPVASFSTSVTAGCNPLNVVFTNTSQKGDSAITAINWDFRNGVFKTGETAQFTYNKAGKYGLMLKVTDKNGCYAIAESDSLIQVVNKPVVGFTASVTHACEPPLNVSFTNQTTGASNLTYLWDYGNGQTSTQVSNSSVFATKGSFNVKLTATDEFGCSSTLTKDSYVNIGNPPGTLAVLDSQKNPVTTNRLCSGTYTFQFSIPGLPLYNWTINDNKKIISFSGQQSFTYTVQDTGTIKISLAYGNELSCSEVVEKTFLKSSIKADFTPDKTLFCALPQQINFTNTSTNPETYKWYIQNVKISEIANPSYNVNQNNIPPSTYRQLYSHEADSAIIPVKLVVTNKDGCRDSVVRNTYFSTPVARFMPDKVSGCAPLKVNFSDSSKWVQKIDSYEYLIEGNTLATVEKSLEHTFNNPGVYNIREIVKSGSCRDTSVVVRISVGKKIKPEFTVVPSEVCNGGKIRITANSDNNSAVGMWNLKSANLFDFNSSNVPDTSITVLTDTTGFKSITLRVEYNGCFSDTTRKNIFKINGPAGNFTETFSCDTSLVYRFKSKMTPATTLTWNIDTATISGKDSVRYKFPVSGDFNVSLTASDIASGCSLTTSSTVKVRQVKASYAITDSIYCVGDSIIMNASKSVDYINSCFNEGFLWYFGDDSPPRRVKSPIYSHIYSSRGKFKLMLLATADNGCVDSVSKNVYIKMPEASFTVDKYFACLPSASIEFNNNSTDSTIVSQFWDFGDQTTSSSPVKKFSHTYTSATQKTFIPTLRVYDAYQCYGDISLPVSLMGINSEFQADDNAICAGQKVSFFPIDNQLDSMSWSFGDGTGNSKQNEHVYSQPGLYQVSLKAYKKGCTGITSKKDYISAERASATFVASDTILKCYPETVTFAHTNKNGNTATQRTWLLDLNESMNKSDTLKFTYTRPGNYETQLLVRTLNGCEASATRKISVTGPQAKFGFTPKMICYGEEVHFAVDSMKNVNTYKWIFGDGNTSALSPVSHRYTSKGKIIPAITLTNSDCSVTLSTDTLQIDQVTARFGQKDSIAICYGNAASFKNTSTFSQYWTWQINDVFRSNDLDINNIVFPKKGLNTVRLIASSDNCNDTIVKSYMVYSNPEFSIQGDSILCFGQKSIEMKVNQPDGWKISWSPATGLNSTSSFTVSAQPAEKTIYNATVTDVNGCKSTKQKTILVNQLAGYSRIPAGDTTISIGDNIPLKILAGNQDIIYTWSPNYNITCLNCSATQVKPLKDATYTVQIKNTCVDFSEKFNIKVIYDFVLEAPSAFTPNGDSNNDIFRFEEKNIRSFELKIFNRWGQLVFSTNNISEGWDGSVNGKTQNADTYSFFVKAETATGYKFEKHGNFLLLK